LLDKARWVYFAMGGVILRSHRGDILASHVGRSPLSHISTATRVQGEGVHLVLSASKIEISWKKDVMSLMVPDLERPQEDSCLWLTTLHTYKAKHLSLG